MDNITHTSERDSINISNTGKANIANTGSMGNVTTNAITINLIVMNQSDLEKTLSELKKILKLH